MTEITAQHNPYLHEIEVQIVFDYNNEPIEKQEDICYKYFSNLIDNLPENDRVLYDYMNFFEMFGCDKKTGFGSHIAFTASKENVEYIKNIKSIRYFKIV